MLVLMRKWYEFISRQGAKPLSYLFFLRLRLGVFASLREK